MGYSHIKTMALTVARATGEKNRQIEMIVQKVQNPELDKELQAGWVVISIVPCPFNELNAVGLVAILGKN